MRELKVINAFIDELNKPLRINPLVYDLDQPRIFKVIEDDWLYYMGTSPGIDLSIFNTSAIAFDNQTADDNDAANNAESTVDLGDRGEAFIMKYEKEIVAEFNRRLVNKVNHLGRTHGLGYDITSIEANRAENRDGKEMIRYIEVKTTARVSPPNPNFEDTINLTRNEWVAAEQQKEHYYIYRLYFTNSGTYLYILKNPYKKNEDGTIYVTPTAYRLEYAMNVVDETVTFNENE